MIAIEHPLPFQQLTPQRYLVELDELLALSNTRLDTILATSIPTYETVLNPLDKLTTELTELYSIGLHLESILGGNEWREVMSKMRPKVTAFFTSVHVNPTLFGFLEVISNTELSLTPLQRRHVNVVAKQFRLGGASLNAEDKKRFEAIELSLAEKTAQFAQNAVDATDKIRIEVPINRLGGLPERVRLDAMQRGQDSNFNGAILTGDAVCVTNVLRFADDRSIREKLWIASSSRASKGEYDNRSLLIEILRLRQEKAKLLGFPNVIDLTLETRMANGSSGVKRFLRELLEATEAQAQAEHQELTRFARSQGVLDDAGTLAPWDISFAAERLRKKECNFEDALLKPFTTLPKLLDGMFELAQDLFNIRFVPCTESSAWHDDVLVYCAYEGDRLLGCAYFDLHPRQGKRSGAWMYPLCSRMHTDGVAIGVIAANLTRGSSYEETALDHREVQTLYHEFGHLLHHLLSDVSIGQLAGTNVAWDFVELPSQLLENWIWTAPGINRLLKHQDTSVGPDIDLIERLISTRTFRCASGLLRQISFALLDLELHGLESPENALETAFENAQRFSPTPLPDSYSMVTTFGHLFSSPVGYAAGYYSYLWSQMLEADVFQRFLESDLFSAELGRLYRQKILAVGNTIPPMDAFVSFMAREPSVKPMLERYGLDERPQR